MQTRFKERYEKDLKPAMKKKFDYKNDFEVPKLEKIVINMGVGDATQNRAAIDGAVADLTLISGQKPVVTKAKKPTVTKYLTNRTSTDSDRFLNLVKAADRIVENELYVPRDCMSCGGCEYAKQCTEWAGPKVSQTKIIQMQLDLAA